ncbi:Uncharacterised protein [Corynebacterium kutscheri]|uniref:Uncharacterized protein n=1 Tax=Corynebacterium kutscheri TaxID=35755 RepID=A0A0F6R0C9_9CORY|nr:hypothetical protein UL82_07530 [Corynebacterium kutscheri]VEH09994.1 Uncharacterised protein [Corynebacterium kutscheri]VEH80073.1 Uncharacterised protein [Corynebacterium kutscheri]
MIAPTLANRRAASIIQVTDAPVLANIPPLLLPECELADADGAIDEGADTEAVAGVVFAAGGFTVGAGLGGNGIGIGIGMIGGNVCEDEDVVASVDEEVVVVGVAEELVVTGADEEVVAAVVEEEVVGGTGAGIGVYSFVATRSNSPFSFSVNLAVSAEIRSKSPMLSEASKVSL